MGGGRDRRGRRGAGKLAPRKPGRMKTREIHETSPRQGIGGSKAESLRGSKAKSLRGMYAWADPVQGGQAGVSERAQLGFKTCKPWVRADSVSSRQPVLGAP